MLKDAPIPAPVLEVVRRLKERGYAAYLVGGCVRDLLRGVQPKDFDVATSALPTEVVASFRRVIPTGIEHGTVTVLSDGHPVEVTTFRLEGAYVDGRRPSSVEFHSEIEVDLSRRDFTINAMAYEPGADGVVDPFGGQKDLSARVVRCVGQPRERFSEDGLRALRAIRFAAVLEFQLDPATQEAIGKTLDVFRRVSMERVRDEFLKLLVSNRPRFALELLDSTGLLACFLPELSQAGGGLAHSFGAVEQLPPEPLARLCGLLHELGAGTARSCAERLKLPNKLLDAIQNVLANAAERLEQLEDDPSLRRFAASAGTEHKNEIFSTAQACLRAQAEPQEAAIARLERLEKRLEELLSQKPPLTTRQLALDGRAIMAALGTGPSPLVGEASRYLLAQVLEDPARNTPEKLAEILRNWADLRRL